MFKKLTIFFLILAISTMGVIVLKDYFVKKSEENESTNLPKINSSYKNPNTKDTNTQIQKNEPNKEVESENRNPITTKETEKIIKIDGKNILERFNVPTEFERVNVLPNSYDEYLRTLSLKPHNSKVKYYNGETKNRNVYEAVMDVDVGKRDLQQCADAVMRLWAEYNYKNKNYDKIHFNFTNGFRVDYTKWMEGYRIKFEGNKTWWIKRKSYSNDYSSFREYLDIIFAYAGTLSLSREMKNIPLEEMQIGDIFLKGATPGHCVLVVDMAVKESTGEEVFMLAQSYMPAQDIHILKNNGASEISPWYDLNFGETLNTPEWIFNKGQLYRFEYK